MTEKKHILAHDVSTLADVIAEQICLHVKAKNGVLQLYGVPRGGIAPAYAVAQMLEKRGRPSRVVGDPGQADVIIDDLVDSGATRRLYHEAFPGVPFMALVDKRGPDAPWVVFPWEKTHDGGDESATDIAARLLQYIGEDPQRGGLLETPKRFLKAWDHWTKGYREDPETVMKVFEDGAEGYDEFVIVKNIPAYSKCEHHLADIFGTATVGYIPDGRVVGLSKLSRLVDCFGRRLQVQERWTTQIADTLMALLKPKGVGVILDCRHMCMESRGVCQQGHSTVTSALRGAVMEEPETRAEFMRLAGHG